MPPVVEILDVRPERANVRLTLMYPIHVHCLSTREIVVAVTWLLEWPRQSRAKATSVSYRVDGGEQRNVNIGVFSQSHNRVATHAVPDEDDSRIRTVSADCQ